MSTITKYIVLLSFLLIIGPSVHANTGQNDLLNADFYVNPPMKVLAINKTKNDKHAEIRYFIRKRKNDIIDEFEVVESGQGNYAQHGDVLWETTTNFSLQHGLMQINTSTKHVYHKNRSLVEIISKDYDYEKNVVTFKKTNSIGSVVSQKEFPILGPICDDTNLVHFVRGIYVDNQTDKFESFYLLTSEPKLYKVNTKYINNEVLSLPGGEYEAIKLQLMADLGVLTEIAAKVVTPTYVWLSKDYPHMWLQYEGLESGRYSPKVKTYILDNKGSGS